MITVLAGFALAIVASHAWSEVWAEHDPPSTGSPMQETQRSLNWPRPLTVAGIITLFPSFPLAQVSHELGSDSMVDHPYVGMWVTEDGLIRHELLPNHRYDEARGERKSAYQGHYKITGKYIEYWDDTGFTADGEFIGDVLYHAGMVLHRKK